MKLIAETNRKEKIVRGRGVSTSVAEFEAKKWVRTYLLNKWVQIGIDGFIAALALLLAYELRFDGLPPDDAIRKMYELMPVIAVGTVMTNLFTGCYKHIWRYTSIPDTFRLAYSAAIVAVILLICRATLSSHQAFLYVPFGIILINYMLATSGMIAVRIVRRVTYEAALHARIDQPNVKQRVLLVGAGNAGVMTAREISRRRDLGFEIRGFVDDDKTKWGNIIHNVRVLGGTSDIPSIVRREGCDQVIITMASAPRKTIRRILDICEAEKIPVKIIPGIYEILGDHVTVSKLRPVEIEDLLGRETIDITAWLETAKHFYTGKKIMVSGAGGSIGRELCHQLAFLEPASIILLDKDENGIFEVERMILAAVGSRNIQVHALVCDLRIEQRLNTAFNVYRPQVVFHAAAYKHVPLMERDAPEAVLNNIWGTALLLEKCAQYQVEQCVMVSTDKAVNPTSIMGATKRVAELMFQAQAFKVNGKSRYSCVRFGNVLGSRGSVVPIFRDQIANGGPVTITHPEMERYFMTIPEAAQLIIQAGALGQKGEIFLLDMGEPVKVLELAKDMIRLSGFTVGEDINIKFTGLRPGEKLKEELLIAEEGARATKYEKIFVAPPIEVDLELLDEWVKQLIDAAYQGDDKAIFTIFRQMEIGFQSSIMKAATV